MYLQANSYKRLGQITGLKGPKGIAPVGAPNCTSRLTREYSLMRTAVPISLTAAAVLVGGSLAAASATVIRPISHTQTSHFRPSLTKFHAVPGRANAFIGHAVYRGQQNILRADKNKNGCVYVSDNISGVITIYSGKAPYTEIGTLTSPSLYGWGVAAAPGKTGNVVYAGTYSDRIDFYSPCSTATATGSVTGTGNYPYGMTVAPNGNLYAASWPSNTIDYWAAPVTSGEAPSSGFDAYQSETYFVDADTNYTYVSGYASGLQNYQSVDRCSLTITSCTNLVAIPAAFPGGVQIDSKGNLYINDQYGTLFSFRCRPRGCTETGTYTYSNGSNPLYYSAIALDATATNLWAANNYDCGSSSSSFCGDAQRQSLPLLGATLNGHTAELSNAELLGLAVVKADNR
jgi:hypothetical protein